MNGIEKDSKTSAKLVIKEHLINSTDRPIPMTPIIEELQEKGVNPNVAFSQILKDETLFDYHYYALRGLRSDVVEFHLSNEQVSSLLEASIAPGLADLDEWLKTESQVAHWKEYAPILLEFTEKRILDPKTPLRDRVWWAITAAGAIVEANSADIPDTLIEKIAQEISTQDWDSEETLQANSALT